MYGLLSYNKATLDFDGQTSYGDPFFATLWIEARTKDAEIYVGVSKTKYVFEFLYPWK